MTSSHNRFIRVVVLSVCLAATGIVGVQPAAAATKTYGCPDYPTQKLPTGRNGGYWTNISARGSWTKKSAACKAAHSLVRAYYNCRRAKGVRGSCNGQTINGLRCRESNRKTLESASGDLIQANVTCTKGSKRIKHTYTQGLKST
jgi:hypothetical protein